MPEPTNPGGANPPVNPATPPNGADPNNPDNKGGGGNQFDPSKIGDEEFAKVFEDPRLFQHKRFKELAESKQKLKEIEAKQAEAEKQRLAEEGKWKELAEKNKAEAETARQEAQQIRIDNALMSEAAKQGISRLDLVGKLIDKTSIKIDENGQVVGVKEAIEALVKDNDFLKGSNNNRPIGNGTNPPANPNLATKVKMSDLKNPKWYNDPANKDLIAGVKTGKVQVEYDDR